MSSTCWHIQNPELFSILKKLLADNYNGLHLFIENNTVYIRGNLVIKNTEGKELGSFEIEIEVPANYPEGVPIVRETAGKLAKIANRHFNGDENDSACLFVPEARFKYYPKNSSIVDFIEGPVKSFFLWQIDYDLNGGKSSIGGMSHGLLGKVEFYREELDTRDTQVILKFIKYLISRKIKKHWSCYCGSGKELRFCHLEELLYLREKISKKDADKTYRELILSKKQLQILKDN